MLYCSGILGWEVVGVVQDGGANQFLIGIYEKGKILTWNDSSLS